MQADRFDAGDIVFGKSGRIAGLCWEICVIIKARASGMWLG